MSIARFLLVGAVLVGQQAVNRANAQAPLPAAPATPAPTLIVPVPVKPDCPPTIIPIPGTTVTPGTPTTPGTPATPATPTTPSTVGTIPGLSTAPTAAPAVAGLGTAAALGQSGTSGVGTPTNTTSLGGYGDAFNAGRLRVKSVGGGAFDNPLNLPNPAGGGVVGRTKLADDNNPLPRDRFIFSSDYFGGTQLDSSNADVYRFSVGFEKTFLDGLGSLEVRLPFAGTINNRLASDGFSTGERLELGNLNLTLKSYLYKADEFAVTGGTAVALPLAGDTRVNFPGASDVIRVDNESIILTPFVAAIFTPTEDFYALAFYGVGFDVTGSTVRTGTIRQGRINDPALSQLDVSVGYWLYRAADESSIVQAIIPFVEGHYNATISNGRGATFSIPSLAGLYNVSNIGSFEEVNISFGFTTLIGNNLTITTGAVLPLTSGQDRTFDYQFGIRGSWLFGNSTRNRNAAVSTFGG